MDVKEFLYFYRVVNWKDKINSIRPALYTIFGYIMAGIFMPDIIVLNTLCIAGILIFSYTINDYFDWKIHGETNFLSTQIMNEKISEKIALIYSFIPLILCIPVFFIFPPMSTISKVLLILIFLVTTFYSLPPLRLKEKDYVSFVTPPLVMTLMYLQGVTSLENLSTPVFLLGILIFIYHLYIEAIHVYADWCSEEDYKKIKDRKSLNTMLRTFPLISIILSIMFSIFNRWFLVTTFFGIVRSIETVRITHATIKEIRKNFFSPVWSLYEFAIYGIIGMMGFF